jgi:hypothetical protein
MQNSLNFVVVYPSQIACGTFGGSIVVIVGMRGHLVRIRRQSRADDGGGRRDQQEDVRRPGSPTPTGRVVSRYLRSVIA